MLLKLRYLLLCAVCCLLTEIPVVAMPSDDGALVNVSLADGLSGETVLDIMTDRDGYTWIATTGGVSVFDGRNLLTLRIQNEKGRVLEVRSLCETRCHGIYAATEGGVYQLTAASGRFQRVLPEVESAISLLAVGDTVFIGSEQGFMFFDGQQLIHQDLGAGRKGLDNVARYYQQATDGTVWFLGRHNLNSYDPRTGRITTHDLVKPMGGKRRLYQFAMVNGLFYIATRGDGLYVYNPATRQAHQLPLGGTIVNMVRRTCYNLISVATDGAGAYLIDPRTEQVVSRYSTDIDEEYRLPTNALYVYYRDSNGIDWFGTVRHGLVYRPHNSRLFRPYAPDGFSTRGMNVRSFLRRGSKTLLGLQDGLWLVDESRHERRYYSPQMLGGHIVNNIQWWQGHYVIGMYDGGIRLLDGQTGALSQQPWSPLLERTAVGDIQVAPDSSLWIGCSDGLFIIQPAAATTPVTSVTGTVRQLTEQNSRIKGGSIIDITFDDEGNAWLAGANGLSVYSSVSHDVVDVNFPEDFFQREPYLRGILGSNGLVYMRNGPQLFYTAPKMARYGEVPLPVMLTDRWCRSMVDDGRGRLWLGSEYGLLGMDYEGHSLIQIGEGEGLPESHISEMMLDSDSTLWICTSQGLYRATSDSLRQWTGHSNYHVSLYNIRVNSDLMSIADMSRMAEQGEIRLTWNFTSQVLQAEPVLLDYARQRNRFYEYRVDGGPWQLVTNGQPIDVRRLLMGTHQLTVRMAGVEGTETAYQLTVVPSVAAYVELVLFIVALVLLWLWWRYRKNTKVLLTERNEIEDALVEVEEQLQDISLTPQLSPLTSDKYQKVKIDEAECADVVNRMKEYIERERIYTNQELKMKDLADVLHLSAPKLSQVFNLYLGQNYYDFINQYRLDEFKRLIAAGEYKRYTITALSEQCGFKRSNFFSTFRKVESMTPAEYLKKQGVKNALT